MSFNRSLGRAVSAVVRALLASALLLSALLASALVLSALLARPLHAQGWIEPLPGRPIPLGSWAVEKTRSQVRVSVEGRVARVVLTEWFENEGNQVAEGDYLYPLPGEAAFSGFSLWQGEDELRGEMMDRERARQIYEEIVRRRADPALIELAGHGLLRARVFPIAPGEERKVELRYTQLLDRSGDALRFRYSGAVRGGELGPRPSQVIRERGDRRDDRRRRDDDRRAGPAQTDFQMVVERGADFLDPFSPTHALERTREGGRLVVRLADELAGELSVFLPLAREGVGLTVAAHRPAGEAGFAMLTLTPGRLDAVAEPRDLTVVVDVSGSMSGEKIAQARDALVGLLETLAEGDRFRLLSFSNSVQAQSEGWTPARDREIERAKEWVQRLDADGGTNISGALAEAFRVEPGEGRLPVVIFLTDGLPTVGERDPERIAAEVERARARACVRVRRGPRREHLPARPALGRRARRHRLRAARRERRARALAARGQDPPSGADGPADRRRPGSSARALSRGAARSVRRAGTGAVRALRGAG
jgi:Ca-activated chloride channel family protein